MAGGHHHHIILRGQGQCAGDVPKIAAHHPLCVGEGGGIGQSGPVVIHHRTELHTAQQRDQRPGDVSRAENYRPLPNGEGERKVGFCQDAALGEVGCTAAAQKGHALAVQQRRGGAVRPQDQPAGLGSGELGQRRFQHTLPEGVLRGDELKQYRHIPAAGHAETVRPGLRQGEVLYLGTPLLQQGQGQQLGLPLYLPAADSAR